MQLGVSVPQMMEKVNFNLYMKINKSSFLICQDVVNITAEDSSRMPDSCPFSSFVQREGGLTVLPPLTSAAAIIWEAW